MLKLLTPEATRAHLPAMMATRQFRNTTMQAADVYRFLEAGALIYPALAEVADDAGALIPRAHFFAFLLNAAGREAILNGAPVSALSPWSPGEPAYALILNVYSTVRNGMARLSIDFSEQLATHPVLPDLRELMWYTRTAKGLAMNNYFGGHDTGRFVTRTFPDGTQQAMPMYTLAADDWQAKLDTLVEKLLGIEERFTEDLSAVHQKLRGQIPGIGTALTA